MDITQFFIDIVKYILAGSAVLGVAYWIFWPRYNNRGFQLKMIDMNRDIKKEMLPLRLQAHERIVLFVERMNPANMVVRLHEPGFSALEFQQVLLAEIRSEYQHNITQQLYVSDLAWSTVKQLKEHTVALIRNASLGLPDGVGAKELSATILTHLAEMESSPYDVALGIIKSELPG